RERRAVQQQITERAVAELELNGGAAGASAVAVIAGDGWHRGVIGLAASKIAERLNRPCVVISLDDGGVGHGSARSTDRYHLLDGLTSCADLFEGFGGHAHAAGLAIRREHIPELRRRLNEHAASMMRADDLVPTIHIDAELPAEALSLDLYEDLCALEPYGAGWPRPVFLTRDLRVVGEPRVVKERHLKMRAAGADARVHDLIWWGGAETCAATPRPGQRIELAYALEANTWRGETRLQLVVEDMKESDE
ncbi:MAG: DHHA1 domain-containing protein, partial [Pyrinomonadaceae bacterium]